MMAPMTSMVPMIPGTEGISLYINMPKINADVGSAPEARMETMPESMNLKEMLNRRLGVRDAISA